MEQPAPASSSASSSSSSAPVALAAANYQHPNSNPHPHPQDQIFTGPPQALARGRQARDPQARTVTYNVASLDAFESSLRDYLDNPPDNPEHTDCQLSFWIGSSFLVAAPPDASAAAAASSASASIAAPVSSSSTSSSSSQPRFAPHDASQQPYNNNHNSQNHASTNGIHAQQYGSAFPGVPDQAMALALDFQHPQTASSSSTTNGAGPSNGAGKKTEPKVALSILEALQPTQDPKEKMRKQRAIAKCCVDAIQKCDGYRYSFHNCWNSREDDSFRFSYYCNDSLLNKDRAANGKGAKLGKRATKPVYDCKGVLSIKFSATKQSLDVFYKHIPVHKTYEERAPPPRKDSRRRKFLEENDPEALKRLQNRPKPFRPDLPLEAAEKAKKKRKAEDPKSSTSLESDLRAQSLRSLLELIRDPGPDHSPPLPLAQQQQQQHPPPPPLPPPPPPPPPPQPEPVQQEFVFRPPQQLATRKRPSNSCDVCKAKKTKCDGARPVCQTCIDKKRPCVYSNKQLTKERRSSAVSDTTETNPPPSAATSELSELERMRKELEDAKARIHELEEEKRRSSLTPAHTPQMTQMSQPPRPQHRQSQSSETPPQMQTQTQKQTQSQPQPREQKQQRQHSRSQSLQQQQPQKQKQKQQQQQQPFQHQMPTPQAMPSPQQAMQQLQTAAQQLQTPQHQYSTFQNPYGITTQQSMPRNAAHASQPQAIPQNVQQNVQSVPVPVPVPVPVSMPVQAHQMGVNTGMAVANQQQQQQQQHAHQQHQHQHAPGQENPYARGFAGEWGYYGYHQGGGGGQGGQQPGQHGQQQPQHQQHQHQGAGQQHAQQEGQWGGVRSGGVFR